MQMGIFPSYDIAYVLFQVSMMTVMTGRCTLLLWEQGEAFEQRDLKPTEIIS